MLEDTYLSLRIYCMGASLSPVYNLLVEHHAVCFCESIGVLILPHHDFFYQVHAKRLVGFIFSHEKCNFHVLFFFPFLGQYRLEGGFCLERFCFVIFVIFISASVVTGSYQIPELICLLIETCDFTLSRYFTRSRWFWYVLTVLIFMFQRETWMFSCASNLKSTPFISHRNPITSL